MLLSIFIVFASLLSGSLADKYRREFQAVNFSSNGKMVSLESRSNTTKEAVVFGFGVVGFPQIRLSYKQRSDNQTVKFQNRIGILKLIEYNETIPISSSESYCSLVGKKDSWSDITQTLVQSSNETSAVIKKFSSTFTGSGNCTGLSVTVDAFVSNSFARYNSTNTFKPYGVKYSMSIQNYTYKYDNSSLAIIKGVFTSGNRMLNSTKREIDMETAKFNWDSSCETNNGTNTTIINDELVDDSKGVATTSEDVGKDSKESVKLIAFKVQAIQPTLITWDPELELSQGEIDASTSSGLLGAHPPSRWLFYGCILLGLILAF